MREWKSVPVHTIPTIDLLGREVYSPVLGPGVVMRADSYGISVRLKNTNIGPTAMEFAFDFLKDQDDFYLTTKMGPPPAIDTFPLRVFFSALLIGMGIGVISLAVLQYFWCRP